MTAIVSGNLDTLAIRSSISKAFGDRGSMALGSFQIAIDGEYFGRPQADSTLLACSFDEVRRRIENRGKHLAAYSASGSGLQIAKNVVSALYLDSGEDDIFFDLSKEEFVNTLYDSSLVWAPDGDEAFDDDSIVLQFDVKDKVRLIGFRNRPDGVKDLKDIWLDSDFFYGVLAAWHDAFFAKWQDEPKEGQT